MRFPGQGLVAAWAGDAAEVGKHLGICVYRQRPGLQADHAVYADAAVLLCTPDRSGGLLAVDAVDGQDRPAAVACSKQPTPHLMHPPQGQGGRFSTMTW